MAISNQEAQYQLWVLSQDTDSTAEADEARLIGLAIDGIDEITTGLLDRAAEDTSTFVYQSRFRYTGLPTDIALTH